MQFRLLAGTVAISFLAACAQAQQLPQDTAPDADVAAPEVEVEKASDAGPAAEVKPVVDYSYLPNWLCHPDSAGDDACAVDLDATIVKGGTIAPLTEIEPFQVAADPEIDCFYVYPTVSTDPTGNSDMEPGAAEFSVTHVQFARFSSVCRPFAPVYRQITLKGLGDMMSGKQDAFDPMMGYLDIKNAWDYYLENENDGRGVILIGHSQGANMIQLLLENEIIGSPAEDLVISAMPIGYTVPVERETQTFNGMPLCERADQTGCLISYVTFRDDAPPPPTSWFGLSLVPTKQAACVNPQALTGDDFLTPYLSNAPDPIGNAPDFAGDAAEITTPFARLPEFVSSECVSVGPQTYLAVTIHADPDDPRTDRIAGDVYINGEVAKDWGLHLGDMHLAMGNLIEIADAQGKAWLMAHSE